MTHTSALPLHSIPSVALLAALFAGCADAPTVGVRDAATYDTAEVGPPACEANLPRCDFPDGGAPSAVIQQGRNYALSLCNFCHQDSTPGAGDFTGQLSPRPMTTAYGTNLSPDPETGIGLLSNEQIARAVRCNTGRTGRHLCVMTPFAESSLNNDNLCALIAYLRSLPAVRRPIPPSTCTP